MSFSLHSLPAELLLEIGDYLDAASVCTLRLASKASNEAFTPALFRFLKVLTVDIEESVLRSLSVLSGHPVLGAAVRRLDLICLYFIERPRETEDFRMTNDVYRKMDGYVMNDDEADPVAAERRAWIRERKLEQAEFQGQQMCAMLTSLLRGGFVNLDTKIYWRQFWTVAIHAYHTLMLAISAAQPRLSRLLIFQQTKMCSIPTHDAALFLSVDGKGFASVAAGLEDFSISLATTVVPVRPRTTGTDIAHLLRPFDLTNGKMLAVDDETVRDAADMEGVTRLLKLMPRLKSLHLHLCNTLRGRSRSQYSSLFDMLMNQNFFPSLNELTLRGWPASAGPLLAFISKHTKLRDLWLEHIQLVRESWHDIFAALPSRAKSLDRICLGLLQEANSSSNFSVIREGSEDDPHRQLAEALCSLRQTGQYSTLSTEFSMDDVRNGLQLYPATGGLATFRSYNWVFMLGVDYEPM